MKKRTIIRVFVFLVVVLISPIIGTAMHEIGHVAIAMLYQLQVGEVRVGAVSYAQIYIASATHFQLAMISIGGFIIPEVFFLILLLFKNRYITVFRVITSGCLYGNIVESMLVLMFKNIGDETFDIIQFQKYSNQKTNVIVSVLVILLITNVILEILNGGIKKAISSILDGN